MDSRMRTLEALEVRSKTWTMQAPSISIAIPVYNQVSTIEAAIQSALYAVSGSDGAEIVVSDNHSTDGTAEAIKQFENRIRLVSPPPITLEWLKTGTMPYRIATING